MRNIEDTSLYIIHWNDGDIAIGERSDTGFGLGEIFISVDELPKLIKALQEIERLNSQKEQKNETRNN